MAKKTESRKPQNCQNDQNGPIARNGTMVKWSEWSK